VYSEALTKKTIPSYHRAKGTPHQGVAVTNDTLKATQAASNAPGLDETEGDGWLIQDGKVSQGPGGKQFLDSGAESLTYNNLWSGYRAGLVQGQNRLRVGCRRT
jgi:hypothetical protein